MAVSKNQEKILRQSLKKIGVEEAELPEVLQNKIVLRSPKGPLGQIKVRRQTGLENNTALKMVKKFEENIGGEDELIEKLEAVRDELPLNQVALLDALREPSNKKSLARLMVDFHVEPTQVMNQFAKGCMVLGKVGAAIEAHRNLPAVVKALVRDALEEVEDVCSVCVGTGATAPRKGANKETQACPGCKGSGKSARASDLKQFAIGKLLEVTELVKKGGQTINVGQSVTLKTGGGGGFMERMMQTSDHILYGKKSDVVEAELVSVLPEDSSSLSK
jgi:hypothetical protein